MSNHSPQDPRLPIRVLLVEDHDNDREILSYFLSHVGRMRVVAEAANGHLGLIACGQLKPDVVVTDVSMPVMDGVELTRQINASFPYIPVVVVTAHGERWAPTLVRAGAFACIQKGGDLNDMLEAVRKAHATRRTPDGNPQPGPLPEGPTPC